KALAILRFSVPAYFAYCLANAIYFEFFLGKSALAFGTSLLLSFALSLACMLPHTNFGNIYNSIIKNMVYKHKICSFYERMRHLEFDKTIMNIKTEKKQQKITKKLLKYFSKQTKKIEKLTKTYYKKKQKKGYLDGIKGFALETLETRQETIDKFIFHNAKTLINLCPKNKNFILQRFNARLQNIKNNEPYYDEYVWTAETGENLIKNDCIQKDSSNYINSLQKLLKIKPTNDNSVQINKQPKNDFTKPENLDFEYADKLTTQNVNADKTQNKIISNKMFANDVVEEIKIETLKEQPKTIEKQNLDDKSSKQNMDSVYKIKQLEEIFYE
ncbi:MAG: hypothetical protein ACI4TI_03270, partial [Christensenellales bacterium]